MQKKRLAIVLTEMTEMAARIGGHDLQLRRKVYQLYQQSWPTPSVSSQTRLGSHLEDALEAEVPE